MTNKTIEELTAEVEQLKKVIMPVAMWWNFVELQAEMAEDILENHATVLQCMHSGGSVGVTVGQLRALTSIVKL
jgi:hypothetical protein